LNNSYQQKLKEVIDFGHEKIGNKTVIEQLTIGKSQLWFYIRFMIFNQIRVSSVAAPTKKQNKGSTFTLKIRFLLIFLKRAISGAFVSIPQNKHWLMVNPNAVLPLLGMNGKEVIFGDGYMEYLTKKALKDDRFMLISEFYPPKFEAGITHLNIRTYAPSKKEIKLEWTLLKALCTPSNWMKLYRYSNQLEKSIVTIEKGTNIPLSKKIRQYKKLLLFSLFRELAFEKLIVENKPSSISGTNEHDVKLKSMLEPAKRLEVKTVGIQHGIIHKQHIHYIFSKEDAQYSPFPQMTLTWGDQAKRILHEASCYPIDSVRTVGQIRTDVVPTLLETNQNLDYIFFAGQMYHQVDYGYRSLISKDILEYSANHPTEKIIIKQHPRQSDVIGFWKSLEEPGKVYNYEIVNDDLYKIIAGAKVVITHNSTAGGEAIYFNKPLILADYSKDDLANFIAEGIGKPVYNYAELEKALITVSNWSSSLQPIVNQFIEERAYKIDGKVCERIIRSITS
tara:strand:+ start:27280 stop:28797 length:1518 start_codon:yes stop_codon:yes gene_type:complete